MQSWQGSHNQAASSDRRRVLRIRLPLKDSTGLTVEIADKKIIDGLNDGLMDA